MTNILKYKNKIIAGVVAFVMVFSVLVFVSPTEAQAVSINATDTGFYNLAYGATGETTFGAGTQIRVINDTRSGKDKNDAVYEFDGDMNWSPVDSNKYIVWDGSSDNTFYGVYPYNAEYDKFTIPADQSGGVQDADWMTDYYVGTKGSGNGVDFNFQHRLAKVTVNITEWNSEFDNEPREVGSPKIYSKGTDLTAAYGEDGVTITSTGNDREITPLVDESKSSYTAIVAPVKYNTSDTFMTFTVNGQEMTVKANDNAMLTEGLQAGYHYTFDLTVGKDAVTITSVTVNGWADGGTIDGGVAEEVVNLNIINATDMSTDDLNAAVTKALSAGYTDISITLAADAPAEMFTAIRRALIDTDAQGINLTLAGVTEIPDHDGIHATAIFGDVFLEDGIESVTQLASINLPDVVTIGTASFMGCGNLASVTASKVQTIGDGAFYGCGALTEIKLPKATNLGMQALDTVSVLLNLTIYLTTEEEIIAGEALFWNVDGIGDLSTKVNLVLNSNKQNQVSGNTWTTKDADGKDVSYTFKSITFVGE